MWRLVAEMLMEMQTGACMITGEADEYMIRTCLIIPMSHGYYKGF
jgi:hypothetical protein